MVDLLVARPVRGEEVVDEIPQMASGELRQLAADLHEAVVAVEAEVDRAEGSLDLVLTVGAPPLKRLRLP